MIQTIELRADFRNVEYERAKYRYMWRRLACEARMWGVETHEYTDCCTCEQVMVLTGERDLVQSNINIIKEVLKRYCEGCVTTTKELKEP